jgi:hypothetical protein
MESDWGGDPPCVMYEYEQRQLRRGRRSANKVSIPHSEIGRMLMGIHSSQGKRFAGHVSLDQMKVMSAIERCRTAALGGQPDGLLDDDARKAVAAV